MEEQQRLEKYVAVILSESIAVNVMYTRNDFHQKNPHDHERLPSIEQKGFEIFLESVF